jgi:hypothetical protein
MRLRESINFGFLVLHRASIFEPRGIKNHLFLEYFHPPGCEIDIPKFRGDFMKQPRDF